MRAQRLIIWVVEKEEDEEANAVANALYNAHVPKCNEVELWKGLKAKCVNRIFSGHKENLKDGIGIYIVFHSNNRVGPHRDKLDAKKFINKRILTNVKKDHWNEITKVVFVVCDFAPSLDTLNMINQKTISEASSLIGNERQFLLQAMFEFHSKGVRPKVVGWDCFVSALPHTMKGRSVYSENQKKRLTDTDKKDKAGRKYIQGGRPSRPQFKIIRDQDRQMHKRIFMISEGGKIQICGFPGWSFD